MIFVLGAILCTWECLAVSLASAHLMPIVPLQLWQPKISLDIVKCPLRGMLLLGNNNKIVLYSLLIVNIFLFQESLLSPLSIFLPPLGPTPRDHAECSISEMLNLNTSFYKISPNFPYISIFHSFIIKHLFSIYSFSIYYWSLQCVRHWAYQLSPLVPKK